MQENKIEMKEINGKRMLLPPLPYKPVDFLIF